MVRQPQAGPGDIKTLRPHPVKIPIQRPITPVESGRRIATLQGLGSRLSATQIGAAIQVEAAIQIEATVNYLFRQQITLSDGANRWEQLAAA